MEPPSSWNLLTSSLATMGLEDLSLAEMRDVEPRIDESVYAVLGVEKSVSSRTSFGGTAPDNVRAQAEGWLDKLRMTEL